MIRIVTKGSFKHTESFLKRLRGQDIYAALDNAAREGVAALRAATPVDSGITAAGWDYVIERSHSKCKITWINTHTENGFPVAVMLQYGHGTGTGGYVAGRDYINPAIKPVFDRIAESVWKAVTKP